MSDWDRPGFVEGFCNALARRIARLEDSVAELEARIPAPEIVTRAPRESPTHDGRIVVDANEWERLNRLHKAAIVMCPYLERIPAYQERDFDVMQEFLEALHR